MESGTIKDLRISAIDLRFNNLVLLFNNGKLKETRINPITLYDCEMNEISLIPIPITEKLLIERCGFSGNGFINNKISGFVEGKENSVLIYRQFLPSGGFIFEYQKIKILLRGLHHLQNIWYFIFDKELEIKDAPDHFQK